MYYLKDKNAGMQKTSAYQEQDVLQLLVQHPTCDNPDVCPAGEGDDWSLLLSCSSVAPL